MPRTETAVRFDPAGAGAPTPAAAMTFALPRPLPRSRRPIRGVDGRVLLDWKDMAAVAASLTFLARAGRADDDFVIWLAFLSIALAAPVIRRLTVGGPREIQRDGFFWSVARVAGGISLFCGASYLVGIAPVGLFELLLGCGCLAFGAVIDHLARTPPEQS